MSEIKINLPSTSFPMKANLPAKEPEIIKFWEEINLYQELRSKSKGRDKFILHDGPPYANGHIHIGTALNKILKDIVVRFNQMMGKDAPYVPGWDCHGLPIEWKVEEEYKKKGKNKDTIPVNEFREECRQFAASWIEIQKKEFNRLGVNGDWKNHYTTMSKSSVIIAMVSSVKSDKSSVSLREPPPCSKAKASSKAMPLLVAIFFASCTARMVAWL